MGVEIERKFLVRGDAWRAQAVRSQRLRQGYLANTSRSSVRVRLAGDRAWLSVKSMTRELARLEFEYEIAVADAGPLLDALCEPPLLDKVRHYVPFGRHEWEVDEFLGDNAGLVVAELELDAADEPYEAPAWLGREVTHEDRYYNFNLAARPYGRWTAAERAAVDAEATA
ncbi:MAG: CYTH domain-containing protein [Steroidobacteraceae bacterium]|nr:CYTH domain-containing protein [Steroidobacteraceae bacterium]